MAQENPARSTGARPYDVRRIRTEAFMMAFQFQERLDFFKFVCVSEHKKARLFIKLKSHLG
jgi:hypothetical protein